MNDEERKHECLRDAEARGKTRASLFKGRGTGGFRRTSVRFVRKDRRKRRFLARCRWQVQAPKPFSSFCLQVLESAENSAIRNLHPPKCRRFQENIASICSERTVASEVRKMRKAENLFCCSVFS